MSRKHKHGYYYVPTNKRQINKVESNDYLFIDMHIHTEYSKNEKVDIEIEDLLDTVQAQAKQANKRVCISITDHESMLGCVEAMRLIKENPEKYDRIDFIPGIELNASLKKIGLDDEGHSIYTKCHMLGYGFNIEDKNLLAYSHLTYLKTKSLIASKIISSGKHLISAKKHLEAKYGKNVAFEKLYDLKDEKEHSELFSKFVDIMSTELGVSRNDIKETIKAEFNENGTTCVDVTKESKQDILYMIDLIHQAGGIVSIAHANTIRYKHPEKIGYKKRHIVVKEFLDKVQKLSNNGIDAIEVFHSENLNSNLMFTTLLNYVKEHNMYITAGSDYHGSLHSGKRISKCCSKKFEKCSQKYDKNKKPPKKKHIFNKMVSLPYIKKYKGEEINEKNKSDFSLFNKHENRVLTIDEVKKVMEKAGHSRSGQKEEEVVVKLVSGNVVCEYMDSASAQKFFNDGGKAD